jgi:hypothetical protein
MRQRRAQHAFGRSEPQRRQPGWLSPAPPDKPTRWRANQATVSSLCCNLNGSTAGRQGR